MVRAVGRPPLNGHSRVLAAVIRTAVADLMADHTAFLGWSWSQVHLWMTAVRLSSIRVLISWDCGRSQAVICLFAALVLCPAGREALLRLLPLGDPRGARGHAATDHSSTETGQTRDHFPIRDGHHADGV